VVSHPLETERGRVLISGGVEDPPLPIPFFNVTHWRSEDETF